MRITIRLSAAEELPVIVLSLQDDDERGFVVDGVDTTTNRVNEGETFAWRLALQSQPEADVRVDLSARQYPGSMAEANELDESLAYDVSFTDGEGQQLSSLIFTVDNWRDFRDLRLMVEENKLDLDNILLEIRGDADGGGYGGLSVTVAVRVTDNDERGLSISPTELAVEEGAAVIYTLVLDSQPTGTVSVIFVPDVSEGYEVTFIPESLTFKPDMWNSPQQVTVTSVDNDVGRGGCQPEDHPLADGWRL